MTLELETDSKLPFHVAPSLLNDDSQLADVLPCSIHSSPLAGTGRLGGARANHERAGRMKAAGRASRRQQSQEFCGPTYVEMFSANSRCEELHFVPAATSPRSREELQAQASHATGGEPSPRYRCLIELLFCPWVQMKMFPHSCLGKKPSRAGTVSSRRGAQGAPGWDAEMRVDGAR
ncbi:unnamed protein product [Lampetra planeri]